MFGVDRPHRRALAVNHDIDTLFTQPPLQRGIELQFFGQGIGGQPFGLDIKIEISSARVIVGARAKKSNAHRRPECLAGGADCKMAMRQEDDLDGSGFRQGCQASREVSRSC